MPTLSSIDHVHVYTMNRSAAVAWYGRVLQLEPVTEFASWVANGGPLFLGNRSRSVCLALFEAERAKPASPTIAFQVTGGEFSAWRSYLQSELGIAIESIDHEVAWSLYFSDPDGNRFEITTYDYAEVAEE